MNLKQILFFNLVTLFCVTLLSCSKKLSYSFKKHYLVENYSVFKFSNNHNYKFKLYEQSDSINFYFINKVKTVIENEDLAIDLYLDSIFSNRMNYPNNGYSFYPKYFVSIIIEPNGNVKYCGTEIEFIDDNNQNKYNDEVFRLLQALKNDTVPRKKNEEDYNIDYRYLLDMCKLGR